MKGVNRISKFLTAFLTALAISFFAFLPGSSFFSLVQGVEDTMTGIVKSDLASLENRSKCYVIYDAGSSGTRLYIYQGIDLTEHEGPKVAALARPILGENDKSWQDAANVTTEIVSALDAMMEDGPLDEGERKWDAFDWETQCNIVSASVYATAGMRLAEQKNRQKSEELWGMLKRKLRAKVGTSVKEVDTRTLSGYEEGLYAWLAVREDIKNNDFGIVEMGGASSQVTFPCPECDAINDAVKTVQVEDKPIQIYSYSFLGLGVDEAPEALNVLESNTLPDSCTYGVGQTLKEEEWKEKDCANQIVLKNAQGIIDPYNYDGGKRGTYLSPYYLYQQDIEWYLIGKPFSTMDEKNIKKWCEKKEPIKHKPEYSCFRQVYMKKYLQELNVPLSSETMDVTWTEGAAICEANNCLPKPVASVCSWSKQGCLDDF